MLNDHDTLNSDIATSRLLPEMFLKKFHCDDTLRRLLVLLTSPKLTATMPPEIQDISFETLPPQATTLMDELTLFQATMRTLPPKLAASLVAHRGFHGPDTTQRPIENSLQSMEQAWVGGLTHCECDVVLIGDGQIVLSHDQSLRRLSLVKESHTANQPLSNLTFRQMVATPLMNGVRPPLLKDVLETAHRLGNGASLVVELKHPTVLVGQAMARFLHANPQLSQHVSAVMSFDKELMDEFFIEFEKIPSDGDVHRPLALLLTSRPDSATTSYETEVDPSRDDIDDVMRELVSIPGHNQSLDGLYMEHTTDLEAMLRAGRGQGFVTGLWGTNSDSQETCARLVDLGVRLVNTDMPRNFISGNPTC